MYLTIPVEQILTKVSLLACQKIKIILRKINFEFL